MMHYQVLLVDHYTGRSLVLAQFRYTCDAQAFTDAERKLSANLNVHFTIEPIPGLLD